MIAELGLLALIIALFSAMLLVIIPVIGLYRDKLFWCQTVANYVIVQFISITIAYGCLTWCFLRDDFTVRYVLANSSRSLPWFYKFCAVWGGHEGSMLLWVAILSLWMMAVLGFSRKLDMAIRTRVLVVLGALSVGFILFLLTTSNPFTRQFIELTSQGRDLNPLLQDPGFLFHPPMLYMGYVGFSVAFAFAIAVLWLGRVEMAWTKWTRPWTLAAWCCLTLGITLGSWWAYRELGWGGWWFWDPVENASFMPWLAGTALIHSLAVAEQRRQLIVWTLLLAIMAFALSLIGTFLVRSGVLTSVHAFAVDPQRGLFILIFLALVIGGSLTLLSWRSARIQQASTPALFALISRESGILLNNILLVVALLTVLLGTIYPLIVDGLGLGKLSVGAPYFNTIFVPLMLPLLVLMGIGIHVRWQREAFKTLILKLWWVAGFSVLLPLTILLWLQTTQLAVFLGLSLACWIMMSTLLLLYRRGQQRHWHQLGQAFCGMIVAHLGVAVSILGIAISSGLGLQDDVKLAPGQQVRLAGYEISFVGEQTLKGPNYQGTRAEFKIVHDQKTRLIFPEKRIYTVGQMPMTESAIDVTPFRDLYIALGEPLDENAWSVRLYYKPFVRWIWGGGILIFLGGLLALTDRRYV